MEDLVVELLGMKDNRWHGTVLQAPEKWTAKEWRKVYGFAREGEGMASWTDWFIDGKFSGRVNPKDGYAVVDCKEPRARRVLEFFCPIVVPGKAHESNHNSGKHHLWSFIWGKASRLGSGSEGSSREATFRDGQVQGNIHLPLRLPFISSTQAVAPSGEGVPDQGSSPKAQCGVRRVGGSGEPGRPGGGRELG